MAAREPVPLQAAPYEWNDAEPPPTETLNQWIEVGNGIDKSQTVVWKSAVESLEASQKHLRTSEDARSFVEKYMGSIIGILVEQQPSKIGPHERTCVQDSLSLAVAIVALDLDIQLKRKGECRVLDVLSTVFNKKKAYYKGNKGNWNVNHMVGLPEVRLKMIDRFRQEHGFALLNQYLVERINTPLFPKLESLHIILQAIGDAVPGRTPGADHGQAAMQMEDDAIAVAKAVMEFIKGASDEMLKKIPTENLSTIVHQLQKIFDRLISSRRRSTYEFYEFWRGLILKLITSQSLPLKLFGWEQMNEVIEASGDHAPPPRSFIVSNAGCTFVNGGYLFAGDTTDDGYAQRGVEISYVRRVKEGEEGAGKSLTLFRCTMRSQQKWWFLSEADEEQPGTDRDIDYYQHKSKEHEEMEPPASGWVTCRNAGVDPPPNLQSQGLLVPAGEERNTLEHQLAKWAIENGIIEMVLGDSVHREIVARSTALIKFLAQMCTKYASTDGGGQPEEFCLRTSHLLLAWKTCTRKTDAAVSAQVYQLLVSILPACPSRLAIPLLNAVQSSLTEKDEKQDHLNEVADFCSALAAANPADVKPGQGLMLNVDVRAEVLKLLWNVLTHPDASTLKSYDNLKRYVTNELRVEPKGTEHRETFLKSCLHALADSASKREGVVLDEVQALRMVKLTRFVLEACPRDQAHRLVTDSTATLPDLLFNELTAFLERTKNDTSGNAFRKVRLVPVLSGKVESNNNGVELIPVLANSSQAPVHGDASVALPERLRILRYVYGLSDLIVMSSTQLHALWNLCSRPSDREELMVFIASAAGNGGGINQPDAPMGPNNPNANRQEELLSAAFTEDVCSEVFLNLFCASNLSYDEFGENAYKSFQFLFQRVRGTTHASGSALDALWRICLTAGNSAVANHSMKDLLSVYMSVGMPDNAHNAWTQRQQKAAPDDNFNFGERVFGILSEVKRDLNSGKAGSERSAERCLRILNAAIGQTSGTVGSSMTYSTLARLSSIQLDTNLESVMRFIPHGMRGQACYRRVGIMAKRQLLSNQVGPNYVNRDDNFQGPSQSKNSTTMRFSIDVHPLETLASVKFKVAAYCHCNVRSVKPVSVSGRMGSSSGRGPGADSQMSLNVVPDDSVIDELGIVQGSELVFQIVERPIQSHANANKNAKYNRTRDLSDVFFDDDGRFADKLFTTLLGVLEALPWREPDVSMTESPSTDLDTHKLVWDLLLAMPTNALVAARVRSMSKGDAASSDDDAMDVDAPRADWSSLLDLQSFQRSVYVLLALDAFLQPSVEVLSVLPNEQRMVLERSMQEESTSFRRTFIESGGFDAVVRFFSESEKNATLNQSRKRMGNAVALRVLKCCLFGNGRVSRMANETNNTGAPDEVGSHLLSSLSNAEGLLKSLTSMVVGDSGISTSTISDILKFLRLLFRTPSTAQTFVALPGGTAEQFLITLLMWEGGPEPIRTSSSVSAASKIRKNTHELILQTPLLADHALPWLIRAIDKIDVSSDCTAEYFDVLQRLVGNDKPTARTRSASDVELRDLGTTVCKKVASCPRPTSENSLLDNSTGVLCGCLALLRALIETGGGAVLKQGTDILVNEVGVGRWSEMIGSGSSSKGILAALSSSFSSSSLKPEDLALIDLMGAIFDGFLSPGGSTSVVAICSDKESRQRGFDVVGAAARFCSGGEGYLALVSRINQLVESAAPFVRHKWGQVGSMTEGHSRNGRNTSKYSGLRNQGCTCYMNSVLQQMFMMPELRQNMCEAPLPSTLRSTGGVFAAKGQQLVGKKVSMQWESGVSYDAMVEKFDESSGMHTIRYCSMPVATVSGSGQEQMHGQEIARLPPLLADEFFLSEGRPGKETGVFEIVNNVPGTSAGEQSGEAEMEASPESGEIKESEDEMSSRHLMEEVQRTFIHLDEGSRGRCFDPRALVEACACLKLEFDVWQQNDASEFTTKLLDRLEIALKKWAPSHFQYMDHTFGLKTTKQKICKECGLKTNREEKLLNIDCQIRGKSDIHEALATMTEVEIMEGSNKVFCDRCKKNTDTVLRTALSMLPNMLILSLKRFDLDYNTFETVKLNSRCAFGQTLNMKRYTLEGLEAMEQGGYENDDGGVAPMDTTAGGSSTVDPLSKLADEDYEYKLAGVLVHAGVAQGGHYYSFIKDRNLGTQDQWYRFDDEDVTPFDPASIEVECFGGKVKKETKWPNGQVHTVESEQYANALMLFYEKVKPTDVPAPDPEKEKEKEEEKKTPVLQPNEFSSGYDVFEPDVRRSNATHRWQTFLFDPEFQVFLKGLLGLCRMSNSDDSMKPKGMVSSESTWKAPVIQMLLSFFFDIMLYSSSRPYLNEWVVMMEQLFALDRSSATTFVQRLAKKTLETSSNWLRTYLIECPDQPARNAAVRIYSAAVASCVASDDEQKRLGLWAVAWKEELQSFGHGPPTALPTMLGEKSKHFEDPYGSRSSSTSIGRIISYLNVLIEVLPRYWRYSPELACFARNMACIDPESGGRQIRKGMLQAMIPARLIALVTRERSHHAMRAAFPGASVSVETAETQMRPESNPVAHVMPLSGNHVMTPTDMNSRGNGAPMPSEFISVFEAVGCLANIRGMTQVPLVVETEENTRGRARVALNKPVTEALSTIFGESCAPQAPGLGQREIESYLSKCGVDSSAVPTQKIVDIMAKYPSTGGGNGSKGSYLSLEGFLAYYRDTAQTNEARVRQDLHTFGYRPDLSRRSNVSRINPDKDQMRPASESVAIDVANSLNSTVNCGPLAEYAFDSFQFFQVAYSASEPMAEHLLAGLCYGREAEKIIFATLKAIYQAPTGWGGNETLSAAIMVLKILASIPDDYQQKRVMFMLQCSEKPAHNVEHGAGLLVAARAFHQARPNQPYSSEMHYAFDRYVFVTKELLRVKTILQWLHENRPSWSFMERELLESNQHGGGGGRHGGQMRGMHDSEDDEDDDSRFEEMDTYHDVPSEIVVEGAGQSAVNGTYMRDGFFESAAKYSMQGKYNGDACMFQLFQCNVSNNTKHWYISIVPKHSQPGTSTDIDFYSAPVLENCTEYPPQGTWTKSNEGLDPPPKLIFSSSPSSPLPPSEERGGRGGGTYI